MAKTTVAIEQDNVNQVKVHIVGTVHDLGSFYAQAAEEKIARDKKEGKKL